jgi:phosphatidylserine/phosphatidylglycerophosphate/cardiolipin synthase-like enzyme
MHDKLLVTDGAGVIAGGRNVESTYYGLGRQVERRNYLDLDMEVEGEVAREARAYFLRTWASRHVRPIRPRATEAEKRAAGEELDGHKRWIDLRVEQAESVRDEHPPRPFAEVGPVRFLHDPIGERRARGVGRELRNLLGEAKESALIESPYLIPSRKLREALEEALARGVKIRILTNSLGTTDNLFVQAGYVGHKKDLVAMGVELWEYAGPDTLHSKAALFDGETVIVGSYNLDPLSESKNSELALVVRDRGVAAELAASFEENLTHSWRIDPRGWPEGHDEPFPGVGRGKICRMRLLRLLVPFIKGIL